MGRRRGSGRQPGGKHNPNNRRGRRNRRGYNCQYCGKNPEAYHNKNRCVCGGKKNYHSDKEHERNNISNEEEYDNHCSWSTDNRRCIDIICHDNKKELSSWDRYQLDCKKRLVSSTYSNELKSPSCWVCGCSCEFISDTGERVCWCATCQDTGCDYDYFYDIPSYPSDERIRELYQIAATYSCTGCGCSSDMSLDGERICWCDSCRASGCCDQTPATTTEQTTSSVKPCRVCGCSSEMSVDRERICWCDSCRESGCCYEPTTTTKQSLTQPRFSLTNPAGTKLSGSAYFGLGGPCGHGTKKDRKFLRKQFKKKLATTK